MAPTLFHFTVDPVASFRSLELDLIKIRAGEALTPPIKSLILSSLGENHHSARERYPPPPHRSVGTVYKGGTFRPCRPDDRGKSEGGRLLYT